MKSAEGMAQLMAYWIVERENMRIHKEAGLPWPHSQDPILANNRFCNVRREDDKVTRWIRTHMSHNRDGYELARITLCRLLNNIPTLEALPVEWYGIEMMDEVVEILYDRKNRGQKVFGSAYVVTTCGVSMEKIDYVQRVVEDAALEAYGWEWSNRVGGSVFPAGTFTCEEAHSQLTEVDGLGSFLAAQIIADLKNTPGHMLAFAPDWLTWSAPGPGSLNGLTAYFGTKITPRTYHEAMTTAWNEVRPLLPTHLQDLHMQDFQNCFCEFSKYHRIKFVGGRAKCGYDGTPRL